MEKKEKYTIDDRSNRYLEAVVHWDTYPEGLALALRGIIALRDSANLNKCGSYRFSYVPRDNDGDPIHAFEICHKLTCRICGMNTSHRAAKRMAFRILKLKNCGWTDIRFLSMNIDMRLEKFQFLPGESFFEWNKRIQKIVVQDAKDSGMVGFYVILHGDRIREVYSELDNSFSYDSRNWSPHFHLIGIGKMIKSDLFFEKYNYTYTMQKSTKFKNKKSISEQLVGRVAYRINHCALSFNPSGRQSNVANGYGLLANCMINIISEQKIETVVTNDVGSEYVAKNLIPWFNIVKSKIPRRILNALSIIKRRMVIDLKNTGYARIRDEAVYKLLKKKIWRGAYDLNPLWSEGNPEVIISSWTNEEILLTDTETIQVVQVKGYDPFRISSYELRSDKDSSAYVYRPSPSDIVRVHERFLELKSESALMRK